MISGTQEEDFQPASVRPVDLSHRSLTAEGDRTCLHFPLELTSMAILYFKIVAKPLRLC
jgi:hypothetical protein